jgi:hypothetical protein
MSLDFGRHDFNQANLNSSTNLVGGGFTTVGGSGAVFGAGGDANAVFDQIDTNRDGNIDRNEWLNRFGVSGGGATASGICNPPTYQTDARGFYQDPNPRIETRVNPNPGPTYPQNIQIRFFQPPPVPRPQPIIINEVRPPPPPPPQPFRTTVPARPATQPPPLILRENPPPRPAVATGFSRTVTLPPFPPVPRSVITERYAPLPPRPRDIILERWIPYGPQSQQQTIRKPAPCGPFPIPPRNLIIQYQPVQARVVRHFRSLGVTQADPQAYRQQHGGSLLDSATFLQQARAAGVVEDISPPAGSAVGFSAASYGQEVAGGFGSSSSFESSGYGGGVGYGLNAGGGGGASSYESSSYSASSGLGGDAGYGALVSGGGLGGGYQSSSVESSSYGVGSGELNNFYQQGL